MITCCKTQHRPYDLAVQVALVLTRWHVGPPVWVNSDGAVVEWKEACQLVERELGYPVDPFFVLERSLVEVADAQGQRFFVEQNRRGLRVDLNFVAERGLIPFKPPFQVGKPAPQAKIQPSPYLEEIYLPQGG